MGMTIRQEHGTMNGKEARITVEPRALSGGRRESVTLLVQEGDVLARITLNRVEAEGLTGAIKAALR